MKIALIAPPWPLFDRPSIQVAALKAYLSREEPAYEVQAFHPYVTLAARLGFEVYHAVSQSSWAAEAVGAALLFPAQKQRCDRLFRKAVRKRTDFLGGRGEGSCDVEVCREALCEAISTLIHGRDWAAYGLLAITVCLNQLTAALLLARELKAAAPKVPIVLGGSSCSGALGTDLLSAFPQVDYVVGGEGERPLLGLARYLQGVGDALPVSVRCREMLEDEWKAGGATKGPEQIAHLSTLPVPDFTDYFNEIHGLPAPKRFFPVLPVEFSRGCWWGHCRFCNLNLQWRGYRTKSAFRMATEIDALARRYRLLNFAFVDNVLPRREAAPLFDLLATHGRDYAFFAELRAGCGRVEIQRMARGGLRDVQVGIEALSTSLLKRLSKGASAMDNVAAMRHAEEAGLRLSGNLILHFPGSTAAEVTQTLENIEFVWPFRPLKTVSFWLGLGSPADLEPARFGLTGIKPHPSYADLFPGEMAARIAFIVKTYRGDRLAQRQLWRPVEAKVRSWREGHTRFAGKGPFLTYRDGGDYLIVRQTGRDGAVLTHRLSNLSRRLYLACQEPTTLAYLRDQAGTNAMQVQGFVRDLAAKRLMFQEGDRVLSLAIHERGGLDCS